MAPEKLVAPKYCACDALGGKMLMGGLSLRLALRGCSCCHSLIRHQEELPTG